MANQKFGGEALVVTHSPNPSAKNTSELFPKPIFPYTWYYRTEVMNCSDRELKIIWFEGFFEEDEHWYGSNVLNQTLRTDVFLKWYDDEKGAKVDNEWLAPGEVRVCDPNWHGSYEPSGLRSKWAYIAVDRYGNDYYSESIIEVIAVENKTEC
jgi:hypothetical protein